MELYCEVDTKDAECCYNCQRFERDYDGMGECTCDKAKVLGNVFWWRVCSLFIMRSDTEV